MTQNPAELVCAFSTELMSYGTERYCFGENVISIYSFGNSQILLTSAVIPVLITNNLNSY